MASLGRLRPLAARTIWGGILPAPPPRMHQGIGVEHAQRGNGLVRPAYRPIKFLAVRSLVCKSSCRISRNGISCRWHAPAFGSLPFSSEAEWQPEGLVWRHRQLPLQGAEAAGAGHRLGLATRRAPPRTPLALQPLWQRLGRVWASWRAWQAPTMARTGVGNSGAVFHHSRLSFGCRHTVLGHRFGCRQGAVQPSHRQGAARFPRTRWIRMSSRKGLLMTNAAPLVRASLSRFLTIPW